MMVYEMQGRKAMNVNLLTIIVMFAVVLGLAYAAINFYLVKRLKEGSAKMQEIAAAMLQRQQAKAIVDARTTIVEGAVGMVELALAKLGETGLVSLDDDRKAQMVSNLMVVLCANKDTQPIVNSGTV